MTPGKVAFFSTTSTAAATAPQASCPSTTTSGQPSTPTPYSTLPSAAVSTVLPALRMMNSSPRPRPNSSSGGTRLSEQPTSTQKGAWPRASSMRRSRPWTPRKGASMRKFSLPSFSSLSAWSGVSVVRGHGVGRPGGRHRRDAGGRATERHRSGGSEESAAARPVAVAIAELHERSSRLEARRNARAPAAGSDNHGPRRRPAGRVFHTMGGGAADRAAMNRRRPPALVPPAATLQQRRLCMTVPSRRAFNRSPRTELEAETISVAMNTATTHPARTCRRHGRSRKRPRSPSGCARPEREQALFETGYGPSGLPHIGTFGEVARTTWVRNAFTRLTGGLPSRLLAFSDDMDGLRKVPDNVPNRDMLAEHLGKPLTAIPDPFGTHASFGAHNNARLRAFLDAFGFDYEFASSHRVLPGRTLRRCAAAHGRAARGGARGDPAHPGAGAARDLLALPAHPPAHRRGDAGADGGGAAGGRSAGLARPGQRRAARHAHHRRALQGAVEGRLGAALVRARRRLRDVGQGPDRQREALLAGVPHPGRRAAGGLHLRAVPRRGRAEDQQEQGQRPDHRGMAALRPAGVPRRSSCTRRRSARSGCSST